MMVCVCASPAFFVHCGHCASNSDATRDACGWILSRPPELSAPLENANAKVPGIAFAEWGPGDMAFSFGVRGGGLGPNVLQAARAKVFAATKANKIFFLNAVTPDNVIDMIKEGVMIGSTNQRAAEIGRQ
jgi:hypothetical protein